MRDLFRCENKKNELKKKKKRNKNNSFSNGRYKLYITIGVHDSLTHSILLVSCFLSTRSSVLLMKIM